jgi:ArsR family transcriptional regulator, lead/cadmium/zinc/bismuth-responsive transcriptional repressor
MPRPNKLDRIHGTAEESDDHCDIQLVHPEAVHQAQTNLPASDIVADMTSLFAALGDPTRLRIVAALAEVELCVCDLAATLGLNQSAISHQLRSLRKLGIVRTRRDGRLVYYNLDDEHVSALFSQAHEHVRHQTDRTEQIA